MDPITFGIAASVSAALMGGAAYLSYRDRRAREVLWRRLADARRGRYIEATGWITRREAAIEVPVGQAVCCLDTFAVGSGNHRRLHTRCRAIFSLGEGPRFRVSRAGWTGKVRRHFGLADLALGDPGFDEEFILKCGDPEATKHAWTPVAVQIMRDHFPDAEVTSDQREVKVALPRLLGTEAELNRVLDLVGELASFGGRTLESYRDLEGAIFEDVSGTHLDSWSPALWIDGDRARARVEVVLGAGAPGLRVSVPRTDEGDPYTIDFGTGEVEGAGRGVLDERAAARASRVGPAVLTADDETIELRWAAAPSPAALADGAKLLGELAQAPPKLGAFR